MDLSDPEASYSGSAVLGVGVPLFIGAGFLALGAVFMVVWRFAGPPQLLRAPPVRGAAARLRPGEAAPELAEVPAGKP